jgi:hypothetical protein
VDRHELIAELREKGIWDIPANGFIAVQLVDDDVFL